MDENIDKIIEKLYMGELYPMEEIYAKIDIESPELKALSHRAEIIEAKLKENGNIELLEEYSDIHIKMKHIVSKHSFRYGLKLGIQLMKDL